MERRKKYQIQDEKAYPHMGKMLKARLKENRMTQAELARHLGIYPSGVLAYFDQESLQAGILWKISTALNHNILSEIGKMHPMTKETPVEPTPMELQLKEQVAELEEQVKVLQIELEVYKRITGK